VTRNAGGKGLSDAPGPPGAGTFSRPLKASGIADCGAAEPGGWVAAPPGAVWGKALGGRRTVAPGWEVDVEGLGLTVAEGRVVDAGGVVALRVGAPGPAG
jgi:hypothetical protein